MSTLDKFVDELRAVAPGSPEAERVEAAFHAMQVSDNPILVEECDAMTTIARQRLPLRERVRRMLELMERGLQ